MGLTAWMRHLRRSEGQGLFRVTGSFVPSGHLAVGNPRELTSSVGSGPGPSVPAPVVVFPSPAEEARPPW